jgi:hypothetical protein
MSPERSQSHKDQDHMVISVLYGRKHKSKKGTMREVERKKGKGLRYTED